MQLIQKRLRRAFTLTLDLYDSLNKGDLKLDIKDHPSNTIGDQVWCMIGARESYFEAIKNSEWVGFSCSLKNQYDKSRLIELLKSTNIAIIEYLEQNQLADVQNSFMFDLLEHEIQHHGQLIRYFYSNKLRFPKSWNERYTV
ncbi:MAG: hypothetical protein ACW99Q_10240 [Candidatus Kariarchaeaceae archaeon]